MAKKTRIQVKRVYDPPERSDGDRFLVDRLWPRGLKKDDAKLDGWFRDVAPSDELRRWFGHDPVRWKDFKSRYSAELRANPSAWEPILAAARKGAITLLFGAQNSSQNNAVVLKSLLDRRITAKKQSPKTNGKNEITFSWLAPIGSRCWKSSNM